MRLSTAPGSVTLTEDGLCLHCNAAIPPGSHSAFCCRGCSAVHSLLESRGHTDFYSIRDQVGGKSQSLASSHSPTDYRYLDDPEVVARYASPNGLRMKFYLEGVHCAACVWLTEKLPKYEPSVSFLRLNLSNGIATVEILPGGSFAAAAVALSSLGYTPHPVQDKEASALQKNETRAHLMRLGVAGMAAGNIMLLAIGLYAGADGRFREVFRWTSLILFLPVVLYSAEPFYRNAWSAIRRKEASIDIPIVFGLLVATFASVVNLVTGSDHIYFDSASTLVFLLLSTRYLLKKVHQRAASASELIHLLAPSRAQLIVGPTKAYQEVRTESLRRGDLIRVLPGECIPADGTVVLGESTLNYSLLTGEAVPVPVKAGHSVLAGTWNQSGSLEIEVTSTGSETRLGKILTAMEEGLARKAPIVTEMDRVGQIFVYAVLGLTAFAFLLGARYGLEEGINRALAMAIVVCPCTFALATPMALSIAISRAAKAGVLIRGGDIIERLSKVTSIFFDKTGTLTEGELEVSEIYITNLEASDALRTIEAHSRHPIAQAIHRHFSGTPRDELPVVNFQEKAGLGVSGTIEGNFYEIRSLSASEEKPLLSAIGTQVGIFRNGSLAGKIVLSDRIRSSSFPALEKIRALGIRVAILSGDTRQAVHATARALGIPPSSTYAGKTPHEKNDVVRSTPQSMMVGDGANDAIALASAYVGIAVHGGMEVSLKASGAYSTIPGMMPIASAIIIGQETMKVIRRNLAFAIAYNGIGVTIALSGHLTPLAAALLMPASALTVFLSTLAGTSKLRKIAA